MHEPASNEETAKRLIAVSKKADKLLGYKSDSDHCYYVREMTVNSIVADIVNPDDAAWCIDLLDDMKKDLDLHFDEEDPDFSWALREIEVIRPYFNCKGV